MRSLSTVWLVIFSYFYFSYFYLKRKLERSETEARWVLEGAGGEVEGAAHEEVHSPEVSALYPITC